MFYYVQVLPIQTQSDLSSSNDCLLPFLVQSLPSYFCYILESNIASSRVHINKVLQFMTTLSKHLC